MMLEALVAALCIGGYECGLATKAYYEQTPAVKAYSKHVAVKATEVTGPVVSYVAPAMVSTFIQHTIRVRITNTWTLDYRHDTVLALYGTTF
jgi:hypothetical protein